MRQRTSSWPDELICIDGPIPKKARIPDCRCELVVKRRNWKADRFRTAYHYRVTLPDVCRIGTLQVETVLASCPVFTFYQIETGGLWFLQYDPIVPTLNPFRASKPDRGLMLYRVDALGQPIGRVVLASPASDVLGDNWRRRSPVWIAEHAAYYL